MKPKRRRAYRNYLRCLNRGNRRRANYWARVFNGRWTRKELAASKARAPELLKLFAPA